MENLPGEKPDVYQWNTHSFKKTNLLQKSLVHKLFLMSLSLRGSTSASEAVSAGMPSNLQI